MSTAAHAIAIDRDAVLRDIAARIPVRRNPRRRALWMTLMAVGVASFGFLLATQPQRAWGAYAINTLYWQGIAQGAVVLACAIRLANGRWGGPVMRIAESLSAYTPYAFGFMVVLLGAGIWTYLPWTRHVDPRQAPYLNVPFLYVRVLLGLGLLWWLSRDLVRVSLRSDAYLLKNLVPAELKPDYDRLSADWKGDEEELVAQRRRLAARAPQICVLYAAVYTVLAWDFIMSLTPKWESTLFGWWFFMGCFLTGIAMTALLATQLRTQYRLENYITASHFWDIGKLLFAICIFWAYEFWAQYLPIWYANLPEETGWVFLRFENPWRPFAFAVFGLIFLIPFLGLLNKTTKTTPAWLALFCVIVLSGMWLERHVLVMPSLHPDDVWIGLPEIGISMGFLGVFGWAVQGFLAKYPAVKVTDVLAGHGGHGH